jgi:hypothetical protein
MGQQDRRTDLVEECDERFGVDLLLAAEIRE